MTTREQHEEIQKLPPKNILIEFDRVFCTEEYEKLKSGLTAEGMEDKWNGYFFNDTFYLCRSWTGICIYEFNLLEIDEGYAVKNVRVNRDPTQYNSTDDKYDAMLLDFLISNLILGESKPFPSCGASDVSGLEQHAISGTGYAEVNVRKKPWWKIG